MLSLSISFIKAQVVVALLEVLPDTNVCAYSKNLVGSPRIMSVTFCNHHIISHIPCCSTWSFCIVDISQIAGETLPTCRICN